MYRVKKIEDSCFTVGIVGPSGWEPIDDFEERPEAVKVARHLNKVAASNGRFHLTFMEREIAKITGLTDIDEINAVEETLIFDLNVFASQLNNEEMETEIKNAFEVWKNQ